MKKIFLLSCALLLITFSGFALVGCTEKREYDDNGKISHTRITATQARTMMNENSDVVILDVRTLSEFNERRIDGAILLPHDQISITTTSFIENRQTIILVYCRSGVRSNVASLALVALGFMNVYDFGGINDWPYETVVG